MCVCLCSCVWKISNLLSLKIRLDFEKAENDLLNSINEANGARFEIEKKFQNIEALKNNPNKNSFYGDFDNNDDALMISEANEEIFDTTIQNPDVNNNNNNNNNSNNNPTSFNKDSELYKLEANMNEELSLNSINLQVNEFLNQRFIKCKPDFTDICYGHFGHDLVLGK